MNIENKIKPDFRDGMPFLGGTVWIDTLNSTLSPDGGVTKIDFLADDASFARWLAHAGLATTHHIATERRAAAELREWLRPAFEQLCHGKPLPPAIMARLNALLAQAPSIEQVAYDPTHAHYLVDEIPASPPHSIATQIVKDFVRFLTTYEPERLKHCANPACTMVFYDQGKNSRRRWCSSAVCGNRDKVANYRARKARASSASVA